MPRADYDDLAEIYDRLWGATAADRYAPFVERQVEAYGARGVRVLDLACGTGHLAARLCAAGHRVHGVDASEAMLAHARRRAPEARFVRADLTRDPLPEGPFDFAVCLFDSLNHVLDMEAVTRLFAAVYRALLPGGGFLFDLNTPEGFEHRWRGSFAHVLDDLVVAVRQSWSAERQLGQFAVTWFHRLNARVEEGDGEPALWRREDARILETAHPPARLREALESAGLGEIETTSYAQDETLPAEVGRTFWLARRPSRPIESRARG